jgi:hypothetical protein
MDFHNTSHRDSWLHCRRSFEQWHNHSLLFAVPLRVIAWALSRGVNERLCAWLSHDHLVISNRHWNAESSDKLVVIPTPDLIELRLYRDGALVRKVDTDLTRLDEELDRSMSDFRDSSEF